MRITKALPADARRKQRHATARDDTTTGHRRKIIVGVLLATCISLVVVVGGKKYTENSLPFTENPLLSPHTQCIPHSTSKKPMNMTKIRPSIFSHNAS